MSGANDDPSVETHLKLTMTAVSKPCLELGIVTHMRTWDVWQVPGQSHTQHCSSFVTSVVFSALIEG